jgi:hypothetical protein
MIILCVLEVNIVPLSQLLRKWKTKIPHTRKIVERVNIDTLAHIYLIAQFLGLVRALQYKKGG